MSAQDARGKEHEKTCIEAERALGRFSPLADGWSTAALLAVVDTALRGAAGVEATVAHLNVTRLREPQAVDVIALSRVIRRDRETVHAECWLFSHAVVEAMLHATATLRTADH